MTNPKTKAILFAQYPYSEERLWGMTLTEKLVRQLSVAGIEYCTIYFNPDREIALRKDLKKWHPIDVEFKSLNASEGETLVDHLKLDPSNYLVLQGNTIVDPRILDLLIEKASGNETINIQSGDHAPAAFTITSGVIDKIKPESDLIAVAKSTSTETVKTSDMDSYIAKMRRRMEPFLFEIDNPEILKKVEKVAFTSIYKGATDFITKYVWPLPTRWMVHLISPTGITPNQITYVSMVLSFGAIPFFFMGWFWIAWIMGIVMSFLDTLDGKLARLTQRTSDAGHWLDNASDTIYLWLWYAGIGWYFAEDILDFQDINVIAAWSLVGFFTIDKIITGLFKKLFGAQLHDFAPIDWHARVYIARRNPFLVVLLIGLIINDPVFGLHAMAVWQTATFAFHMMRFIYLPLTGQKHQIHRK